MHRPSLVYPPQKAEHSIGSPNVRRNILFRFEEGVILPTAHAQKKLSQQGEAFQSPRDANAFLAIPILRRCVHAELIQAYPVSLLQFVQPWDATLAPHARGWPETSRRVAGLQISRCRQ